MQGKRTERIGDLVRVELGNVIATQLRDPRIGFVTITRVEMSADLHYAKVFYSVLASGKLANRPIDQVRKETHDALTSARGFLQKDLAQVLNFRYTPHLDFVLDDSIDHAFGINEILKETLQPGENEAQ